MLHPSVFFVSKGNLFDVNLYKKKAAEAKVFKNVCQFDKISCVLICVNKIQIANIKSVFEIMVVHLSPYINKFKIINSNFSTTN